MRSQIPRKKHSKSVRSLLFLTIITIPYLTQLAAEEKKRFHAGHEALKRINRGISLANFLEITNPSNRVRITTDDITRIEDCGFDTIRIPVKWEYGEPDQTDLTKYDRGVYPEELHKELSKPKKEVKPAKSSQVDPFRENCKSFLHHVPEEREAALHEESSSPEVMLARIITKARSLGLTIIISNHHNMRVMRDPTGQREAFFEQSKKIVRVLNPLHRQVYFEILNEPHADKYADGEPKMDSDTWNDFINGLIPALRKEAPHLTLILGGSGWNSIRGLEGLYLSPEDQDPNLIFTVHYYEPSCFAQAAEKKYSRHCIGLVPQEAGARDQESLEGDLCRIGQFSVECSAVQREVLTSIWWKPDSKFPGQQHPLNNSETMIWAQQEGREGCPAIREDFRRLREIAEEKGYPVFLGEFGTTTTIADSPSRVQWAYHIVRAARVNRKCQLDRDRVPEEGAVSPIPWVYWGYNSEDFGIFRIPEDSQRANCLTPAGEIIKKGGKEPECTGQDIWRALMSADKMSYAEIIEK